MKNCTKHWWALRAASMPLVLLTFYFVTQIKHLTATNRAEFVQWAQQPVPTAALAVFVLCSFFHACLGMEEIIDDYVPSEKNNRYAKLANKIFFATLGIACLYALAGFHHLVPSLCHRKM